jgi:hypothetical protein
MASITSSEMADCDWLRSRSAFSGHCFPVMTGGPSSIIRKKKHMDFKTKQQNQLKI